LLSFFNSLSLEFPEFIKDDLPILIDYLASY